MVKVALTGGIATGKSYVLAQLRDRAIPTIDADDIVHALFEPHTPITESVAREFGHAVLHPDGRINRAILASNVFAHPEARLRLEAIVHPVVYDKIKAWFKTVDAAIAVASIPLLYETHREGDFDTVVVTACSAGQQLQRLMERGLSDGEARLRMAAQMPTEEKALRANYVIRTGGTLADTAAQVDELLRKLAKTP